MKAKTILIFIAFFSISSCFAFGGDFLIEGAGFYFQPSEKAFKDIYGNGNVYGAMVSLDLWHGLGFWVGGSYFSKDGKLTLTEEATEIRIIPIYGGIRYQFLRSRVSPYLGVGVGYFQYKESNVIGTVEKGEIGYIGQAGIIFKIFSPLVLDIQASYSHCKVKPADLEANLGGLQIGAGIGFQF